MKLNIGCGNKRVPGFTGVDASPRTKADIIAPADKIPLPDGCATDIMAIHLLEHFYQWEAPAALTEWARLLQPGGLLIMEMPDLLKWARNLVEGRENLKHPDQLHMWAAYGDPRDKNPLMCHRWGYTFETVKPMLEKAGFVDIVETRPQFHIVGRDIRDFRVEACKRVTTA